MNINLQIEYVLMMLFFILYGVAGKPDLEK